MPIARISSFADLLTLLDEQGTPYRKDADKQTVELPAPAGSLVIRWEKRLPYVQIIQVMVWNVPPERRAEVEHAICRANNTIALPGFGFECDKGFVYMRLCVPMYEEGMLAQSFRRLIASVMSNARQFTVPFQRVVEGEPGAKILQLAVAAATSAPG